MVSLMVSPVVGHRDETRAVCWSITGRNRASHAPHVESLLPLTVKRWGCWCCDSPAIPTTLPSPSRSHILSSTSWAVCCGRSRAEAICSTHCGETGLPLAISLHKRTVSRETSGGKACRIPASRRARAELIQSESFLGNEGRPASHAGFVIERATGEGEGFDQPHIAAVVGLETQDASDSPLLAAIRE